MSIISIPVAVVRLFTCDKSFVSNPIIGNRFLNILGLHVARVVTSHVLFNFRLLLLSSLATQEQRNIFRRDGCLIIKNFLPEDQLARLKKEIFNYEGEIINEYEGETTTQRLFLARLKLADLPECKTLCSNKTINKLIRYVSSKNRIPFFYVENIIHYGRDVVSADPQKDFHVDTFHPCVKAWLYLDDVSDRNGPLTIVPGSHRLTLQRIKWEYQQSLIASLPAAERPNGRYWDGSFRVNDNDLQALGYKDPIALKVPANTLVIANVRAIHRRGGACRGASRLAIWMQGRDNPFNPFFSPFPVFTARIVERVWTGFLKTLTDKQVKNGSWGVVSGGFSTDSTNE